MSALEGISGYNPETLLKRLPPDALYEERAILLGKMNQHELALSLYVHKVYRVYIYISCNLFNLLGSFADSHFLISQMHLLHSFMYKFVTVIQITFLTDEYYGNKLVYFSFVASCSRIGVVLL